MPKLTIILYTMKKYFSDDHFSYNNIVCIYHYMRAWIRIPVAMNARERVCTSYKAQDWSELYGRVHKVERSLGGP